jgi:predicted dehydrogenase
MKKQLGVGLIGAGGIASVHLNDYYLKNLPEARLVAVAEPHPETRQRYRQFRDRTCLCDRRRDARRSGSRHGRYLYAA